MSNKPQMQENISSKNSVTPVSQKNGSQKNQLKSTSPKGKKSAKIMSDMSQSHNEKTVNENKPEKKTENIDQVREILFGSQIRAQEESLAQLESRLELEQQTLNQTFNDRLDYIESFFKEEMHSLKQLITGEIEARSVMEKRIDNSIDQQRLEADADIKAFNAELKKTITESTESLENQLEQKEAARTASQNKLQEQLLTKLDKSESLLQTSLAEQKTFLNEARNLAISESNSARENLQAKFQKDLTAQAKQLQQQITDNQNAIESKLDVVVKEQDTKQMDKERLAQHFLDIAAKIQKT